MAPQTDIRHMPARIDSILRLEVPLIVQICRRTMPVDEVVAMVPGTIIELPKSADDDLEILVNNKQIGTGMAVKVGENFGVRVSYIGDLKSRITALGARLGQEVPQQPAPAEVEDGGGGEG